jgi:hypothetical protein
MICGEELRGEKINGQSGIASQVSESGTQSLQNVRTLARLHASIQALPHLLPA